MLMPHPAPDDRRGQVPALAPLRSALAKLDRRPAIPIAVDCELFRGPNRDKCAFLGITLWKPDSRIAHHQRGIRVQVV